MPEAAKLTVSVAAIRSSKLVRPELLPSTMARTSAAALPTQLNWLRSKSMPSVCRICA